MIAQWSREKPCDVLMTFFYYFTAVTFSSVSYKLFAKLRMLKLYMPQSQKKSSFDIGVPRLQLSNTAKRNT